MRVRIMRGLPGSGKSFFGAEILPRSLVSRDLFAVCSADHFFMMNGVYRFDPKKLTDAHKQCRINFLDAVRHEYGEKELVVVDNTNTMPTEIAYYYDLATLFTDDVEILTIVPPATLEQRDWLKQCEKKNQHGVPMKSIQAMADRMRKHKLPWYWKERMVTREDGFFVMNGDRFAVNA